MKILFKKLCLLIEPLSEKRHAQAFEGPVDVFAASPAHPPVPGVLQNFQLVLAGEIYLQDQYDTKKTHQAGVDVVVR